MASMLEHSEMEVGYRGVVMPWECDDMGHLNIRHYVARYREALKHRLAFDQRTRNLSPPLVDRFVFLREAQVGARIACSIGFAGGEGEHGPGVVYGRLWEMSTGDDLARFTTVHSADDARTSQADSLVIDQSWMEIPVEHEWCTAMGNFPGPVRDSLDSAEAATAAISDANALAVFELSRGSDYRMDKSRVGFVVAELVVANPVRQRAESAAFSVYSSCLAHSRRSLTFRHRLVSADAPAEMAVVKSVCVFMDRDSRKAVPIPFEL